MCVCVYRLGFIFKEGGGTDACLFTQHLCLCHGLWAQMGTLFLENFQGDDADKSEC